MVVVSGLPSRFGGFQSKWKRGNATEVVNFAALHAIIDISDRFEL